MGKLLIAIPTDYKGLLAKLNQIN